MNFFHIIILFTIIISQVTIATESTKKVLQQPATQLHHGEEIEHGEHQEVEHGEHHEVEHGEHGEHHEVEHGEHGEHHEVEHGEHQEVEHGENEHDFEHGETNHNTSGHTSGHITTPVAEMVVHSATSSGFQIVFDILNSSREGQFYYMVTMAQDPKPTVSQIHSGTASICHSHFLQTGEKMTSKSISCPLRTNTRYLVWCATDSDSRGKNLTVCNEGIGILLEVATASNAHNSHAGSSNQHGSLTPVSGAIPPYRLLLGGHMCDSEDLTARYHHLIDLGAVKAWDVDSCAKKVKINSKCGKTFYGGGWTGLCGCVKKTSEATAIQEQQTIMNQYQQSGRVGANTASNHSFIPNSESEICETEESDEGDGIYTMDITSSSVYPKLNNIHFHPKTTSNNKTKWSALDISLFVALCGLLFINSIIGFYCCYNNCTKTKKQQDEYTIRLDEDIIHDDEIDIYSIPI